MLPPSYYIIASHPANGWLAAALSKMGSRMFAHPNNVSYGSTPITL
ncbi:hypothetical protein PVOR_25743 [Paenibacillus vortex V453]|uniref:Uncharacterized protein n=1 Tax=Paenibacillus vortex V453 TaxID=715225 RepID=A0A2R9SPG8_9BACL|nr:hypothetical protein [Paenibacillus vortex]EFU39243.1 hypothetical protein PVOR_25743 [Paenibacillus vortex V453]